MNRKFIVLLLMISLVLTAGCAAKGKPDISYKAGQESTTGTTTKSGSTTVAATKTATASTTTAKSGSTALSSASTAATTAAPPLKKGGDTFQKLLTSAAPVFTDKFESKSHAPETINSPFYKQTIPSTRNVSYTSGVEGNGIHLDNYDSYVGYPAGTARASEGTIRFSFKPDANFFQSYNERPSVWKDYGSIAPPFTGFLVDTVGWNAAFSGGYGVTMSFKKGDSNFSYVTFGTWSGSSWSNTAAELTPTIKWDSSKWYDIVVSYSKTKGKTAVYIDGYLAGEAKYNTALSQTEGFFLGQGPWKSGSMEYWPYGPHAMKGTYSFLRIYDQALMD